MNQDIENLAETLLDPQDPDWDFGPELKNLAGEMLAMPPSKERTELYHHICRVIVMLRCPECTVEVLSDNPKVDFRLAPCPEHSEKMYGGL